jgi:hypothetical protein
MRDQHCGIHLEASVAASSSPSKESLKNELMKGIVSAAGPKPGLRSWLKDELDW